MSKLLFSKVVRPAPPNLTAIPSLSRVVNGEALPGDFTRVTETFHGFHPFLKYCHQMQFSEEVLVERQVEIMAALGGAIKTAFGAITGSIVKVGGSTRFLPKWAQTAGQWMGLGTTWGGMMIWIGFDVFSKKGVESIASSGKISLKGNLDRATLEAKLKAMPPNYAYQNKSSRWMSTGAVTFKTVQQEIIQFIGMAKRTTQMAGDINDVVNGKMPVDSWLRLFKIVTGSGDGAVYATPTLHTGIGLMVYKNTGKYFLEEVKATKQFSTSIEVVDLSNLNEIRVLGVELDKVMKSMTKAIDKGLKKASRPDGTKVDPDIAFAYRAMLTIGNTMVPIGQSLGIHMRDYITGSLNAIASYKTEDDTPDPTPEKVEKDPTADKIASKNAADKVKAAISATDKARADKAAAAIAAKTPAKGA